MGVSVGEGRSFMLKTKLILAALLLGAGPAIAGTVTVDTYSSYTETPGTGITFSSPAGTGYSFSATNSFYLDFNNQAGTVGNNVSPYDAGTSFGAVLSGFLNVSAAVSTAFTLGSDDASYLFVDGALLGGYPNNHGYNTTIISDTLSAGLHSFKIEYDNGPCCGAAVGLTLQDGVTFAAVPGPIAGAGLPALLGILGLGVWRRRKASV
jgi:hypothetical protein